MRVRVPPLSIALISIILIAIFAPVTVSLVFRGGDYLTHVRYAILWESDGLWGKPLPHFLYQSLLIFANTFTGHNYPFSASLINMISYLSLGITLYVMLYQCVAEFSPHKRLVTAIGLTLVLILVAPINLLTWNSQKLYYGYIAIQSYHSPTMILLRPMALWLFLFAVRVFRDKPTSVPLVLLCTAIAALSTLTKPNYAICILPALALLTLYALYRKQPVDWRLLIVGIVVPITEVIIWQWFFYRGQGIGGFSFAPLQLMNYYSPTGLLPKFILSLLFPLTVLIFYFQAVIRDISLRLCWIAFAFGAFYMYFLIENRAWQDGNFGWGGEITLFMLFIASVIFLIRQYKANRQWTRSLMVCSSVLALHLISGIAFYIPNLSDAWNTWY
jgi:hypothetical protein